jgi:hypothetical protein
MPLHGIYRKDPAALRYSFRSKNIFSTLAISLALVGCGGGGGAPPVLTAPVPAPPPPSPPPPPPIVQAPISQDDPEYLRSNAAVTSRAIAGWNLGATGRGVSVAVIDSGINPDLAEFAGRIHPASRDVASNRGVVDNEGHGTAVSGVIGAARNRSGPMGVAFESMIMSFNTASPDNCDDKTVCKHSDTAIGQAIDLARQNGARVINISLGGDGVGSVVLDAAQRAAQAGIVVVISAGNESKADPSRFALETASRVGAGHVIIAGSLGVPVNGDPSQGTDIGQLSNTSNRAGAGAQHYLAALGYRVRTFDQNGTAFLYSGTSFSAPVISGAAALLAQAFPNLTGRQIVEILFATADDLGDPGVDSVFGHGRLNIERAFQPRGEIKAAGSGIPLSASINGSTSGAMGDAGKQSFGAIVLDGYSRAFVLDLARTLSQAPQERLLTRGMQIGLSRTHATAGSANVSISILEDHLALPKVSFTHAEMTYEDSRRARAVAGHALARLNKDTAVAFGFSESGRALEQLLSGERGNGFLVADDPKSRAGFLANASNAVAVSHNLGSVALTVMAEHGLIGLQGAVRPTGFDQDGPRYALSSVTAARRIGAADLRIGTTRLREEETVLGGHFSFAPGESASWFFDVGGGYELGSGWSLDARYRSGWTSMPGDNGLVQGGRISLNAWAADVQKLHAFIPGDRLAFRVTQPLRVRSGGYLMMLPVSYDYLDESVGFQLSELSLAPRGRELAFETTYGLSVFEGAGWLSANAYLRREPGHIQSHRADLGAAFRLNVSF